MYNIFGLISLKLITPLRLGVSYLNDYKFWHNVQDCLNPLGSCSMEIEDIAYYLLHCQHFSNHRYNLMNSVKSVIPNFESLSNKQNKYTLI